MLKNSKLLKGITIALACVMVLGAGFILKLQADAQSKVIVRYVSDEGDNTSGMDEASAYTTIKNAMATLAKTEIAPGTEVLIVVANEVSVPDKAIDVTTLKNTAGGLVPITITSQYTDHPDNFANIRLCYPGTTTAPTRGSRSANVVNNITFKNINIVAKVNDYYTDNTNTGKVEDLYRIVGFYTNGYNVVFDRCVFTTDLPDRIKGYDVWSVYNSITSGAEEGSTSITFKNGDYSNVTIYPCNVEAPRWTFGIKAENSTLGPVYLLSTNSKKTTNNALRITAEFDNCTLLDFLPCNNATSSKIADANFGVANGVDVTFNDTAIQKWQGKIDGKNAYTQLTMNLNLTYHFNGNTKVNQTLYLAGSGSHLNGNLVSNVNGATFAGSYYLGAATTLNGDVTHNIKDATFSSMFCAGNYSGTIYGDINTNISGGTFKDIYFGSGGNDPSQVVEGTITNNISGGIFGQWYGGGGNGSSADIVNNISGGSFRNFFHGGGGRRGKDKSGNPYHFTCGTIINNITGGEIGAIKIGVGTAGKQDSENNRGIFFGNAQGDSTAVINKISGGKFRATTYAGALSGVAGSVTNYISGSAEWKGYSVKELKSMGATKDVAATTAHFFGASSCADDSPVENNISGGEFYGQFTGATSDKVVGPVTNNISGGHFYGANISNQGDFAFNGIGYTTSSYAPSVTNNISGGIFDADVQLGGYNTGNPGKNPGKDKIIVNTVISGGIFNGSRILSSMAQNAAAGNTVTKLEIKPGESDNVLLFNCFGEGLKRNNSADSIVIYGAEKPIQLGDKMHLRCDKIDGNIVLSQTIDWIMGRTYMTIYSKIDAGQIQILAANPAVTGAAKIVIGSQTKVIGEEDADKVVSPTIYGVKFYVDSNLKIAFYAPKNEVETYLNAMGSLSYNIFLAGNEVDAGSITSADQLPSAVVPGVGTLIQFSGNFSIPATKYGETITLSIGANNKEFTVYDLLDYGITASASNPALADLLKAINNYGVQSEKLVKGYNTSINYFDDIVPIGTYHGTASTQSFVAGYRIGASALSLGEEVSLKFYLDLPSGVSESDLQFSAAYSAGLLDSDRVVITKLVGSTYDVVVSLRIPVNHMDEVFTLSVSQGETVLASCSNSVLYACDYYLTQKTYADVAASLLAYIEKVEEAL